MQEEKEYGDLTSLTPHERLPELPVVPCEKPYTGTAAPEKPGPGIRPESPALADGFLTTEPSGKPTDASLESTDTFQLF